MLFQVTGTCGPLDVDSKIYFVCVIQPDITGFLEDVDEVGAITPGFKFYDQFTRLVIYI